QQQQPVRMCGEEAVDAIVGREEHKAHGGAAHQLPGHAERRPQQPLPALALRCRGAVSALAWPSAEAAAAALTCDCACASVMVECHESALLAWSVSLPITRTGARCGRRPMAPARYVCTTRCASLQAQPPARSP